MRIDLTCPAEIRELTLPTAEKPYFTLMLGNLCGKTIVSAEVIVRTYDKDDNGIEEIQSRARDLDGRPASLFSIPVQVNEPAAVDHAEAVIERVWFSDSSVWRHGNFPMTEYEPNDLPRGRALENLRFIVGQDAVGYPREESDYWLCVCGRPNAGYTDLCDRCHRDRTDTLNRFSKEAIEQSIELRRQQLELQSKAALEDTSRMQLEREKVWRQKRRRRNAVVGTIGALVVAGSLLYGGIFHLAPYLKYKNAVSAMESGDYTTAQAAFAAMEDYRDADARMTQCRYLAAEQAIKTGDEEQLLAAKAELTELGDYRDADELLQQADLRLVRILLDEDRPDEAEPLLAAIGDAEGVSALTDEMHYKQAAAALKRGDYATARTMFTALGSYGDAAAQLTEAIYQSGKAALAAGDGVTAVDDLLTVGNYKDAAELLPAAWYAKGQVLEEENNKLEAGRAYLNAGAIDDAEARAIACIRPAADAAYAKLDWETAAGLYGLITMDAEANERYQAAAYAWAQDAMNATQYDTAAELLAALPDDYEETLELRQESIYRPALTALENGKWETAIDGFSRISTYRDSNDRLEESRYWLAMQKVESGEWAEAVALLEQTGTFSDSERKLQIARYNLAADYVLAAKYAEAEEIYSKLGTYRDSAEKLQNATYHRAETVRDGGDAAAAREIFLSIAGYSDAAEQADACACTIAAAAEAAGDRLGAAQQYAALTESVQAQEEAHRIYSELATEAEQSGQVVPAGKLWLLAGETDKANACFDAYYGAAAASAAECLADQDYLMVITLLHQLDLTDAPARYETLNDAWNEANYALAMEAENRGDRMAALPYWQAIPGYKDADTRLQRACYGILGSWATADGAEYVFRMDGTCTMNGTQLYYNAEGNQLSTGEDASALRRTHTIASLTDTTLGLRIIGGRMLMMTRTAEAEIPEAVMTVEPEQATPTDLASPTDWLVRDEDEEGNN